MGRASLRHERPAMVFSRRRGRHVTQRVESPAAGGEGGSELAARKVMRITILLALCLQSDGANND